MSNSDLKIKRKTQNSLIKNCSIAFLTGFFIFVLLLIVSSFLILNIVIEYRYLYLFVMFATAVSALFCALFSSIFAEKNRLATGMIVTVSLIIAEFIILLCFNNISLSNNIYFLFPVSIVFGFIGCIIGINKKKK